MVEPREAECGACTLGPGPPSCRFAKRHDGNEDRRSRIAHGVDFPKGGRRERNRRLRTSFNARRVVDERRAASQRRQNEQAQETPPGALLSCSSRVISSHDVVNLRLPGYFEQEIRFERSFSSGRGYSDRNTYPGSAHLGRLREARHFEETTCPESGQSAVPVINGSARGSVQ